MTFKVGDIVICHDWEPTEGKKGFIEEIVVDPNPRGSFKKYGQFSVYGLEPATFVTSQPDLYYGDYIGENLKATGETMTKEKLIEWQKQEPNNKGIARDVQMVIANLGRESGRNEGRWRDIGFEKNVS